MVVELGRLPAEIAVGLVMEVLEVVARIAAARGLAHDLAVVAGRAPRVNAREIGEEAAAPLQARQRVRDELGRQLVVAGGDVGPVALQELAEIAQDAGARRRAL